MFSTHNAPMVRPLEQFMYKVYGWMCAGLAVTAITSYGLFAWFPEVMMAIINSPLFLVVMAVQLGVVFYLAFAQQRMSYQAVSSWFIIYSILMGITLSVIFLVYTMASIFSTFVVTSGMFGIMALYSYYTNTDLTKYGNMFMMALVGIILGGVVNIFIGSSQFDFVLTILGVILFTALTAYDVQKIKKLSMQAMRDEETEGKIAVMGALTLYLDFINLFLRLLRLMGQRKK